MNPEIKHSVDVTWLRCHKQARWCPSPSSHSQVHTSPFTCTSSSDHAVPLLRWRSLKRRLVHLSASARSVDVRWGLQLNSRLLATVVLLVPTRDIGAVLGWWRWVLIVVVVVWLGIVLLVACCPSCAVVGTLSHATSTASGDAGAEEECDEEDANDDG